MPPCESIKINISMACTFTPYRFCILLLFMGMGNSLQSQPLLVHLSSVEGMGLNKESLLQFQIQSMDSRPQRCRVEGRLQFRQGGEHLGFSFDYTVHPGMNYLEGSLVRPTWTFSSSGLHSLFMNHGLVPQGHYRYCVTVRGLSSGGEGAVLEEADDCIYGFSEDRFMLELMSPPDGSRLYEFHPVFSWVATYPFVGELRYHFRLAEIREGQDARSAIQRQRPLYSQRQLMSPSLVYPMDGKPLELWHRYAWTVDAYYRGLHLGGSEVWEFMIVEDSAHEARVLSLPYLNLSRDDGRQEYQAVGQMKLLYEEFNFLENVLEIQVLRSRGSGGEPLIWEVVHGLNYKQIDLSDYGFRHKERFELQIDSAPLRGQPQRRRLKCVYINPIYVD